MEMRPLRILAVFAVVAGLAGCGDDMRTTISPGGGGGAAAQPTVVATASLAGTTWLVEEAVTASGPVRPQAENVAYLTIDSDGTVLGNTGCNGFSGTAEVSDGRLDFAPLISTKVACSGDAGVVDTTMLHLLDGEVGAAVEGTTLTITGGEGGSLVLHATSSPTTMP